MSSGEEAMTYKCNICEQTFSSFEIEQIDVSWGVGVVTVCQQCKVIGTPYLKEMERSKIRYVQAVARQKKAWRQAAMTILEEGGGL